MSVAPVHWLSRPAPGAGLVSLRQTFVRRRYGGLGSSRSCYESTNQKTEGQSYSSAFRIPSTLHGLRLSSLNGPAPRLQVRGAFLAYAGNWLKMKKPAELPIRGGP